MKSSFVMLYVEFKDEVPVSFLTAPKAHHKANKCKLDVKPANGHHN